LPKQLLLLQLLLLSNSRLPLLTWQHAKRLCIMDGPVEPQLATTTAAAAATALELAFP
jgi:hypothetical protein